MSHQVTWNLVLNRDQNPSTAMAVVLPNIEGPLSSPASPAQVHDCSICYEQTFQSVSCSSGHHTCLMCTAKLLGLAIEKKSTQPITCTCGVELDMAAVQAAVDPRVFSHYTHIAPLLRDSQLRECPKCCALVRRGWSDKMACSSCKAAFCFIHGEAIFIFPPFPL